MAKRHQNGNGYMTDRMLEQEAISLRTRANLARLIPIAPGTFFRRPTWKSGSRSRHRSSSS